MEYLILFLLLFGLSWILYKNSFGLEISSKQLLLAWGTKLSFAALFILIFSYYYGNGTLSGDSRNFMNDGGILADYAKKDLGGYLKLLLGFNTDDAQLLQNHLSKTNIWSYGDNGDFINDNRLIIRLNSLVHLFSFGFIWIHVVVFAFISYIGNILIYKAFSELIHHKKLFFWSLFLSPTIAFWGSGISKEALLIFSLGLFFYGLSKIRKKNFKPAILILFGISIFLLLFNKPYVGLVLIPTSVIVISGLWIQWRKLFAIISLGIILGGVVLLSYGPEKINLVTKISDKQKDLLNVGQGGIFFINDTSFCAFDYSLLDHFEYYPESRKIRILENTKGDYKLFGQNNFHSFEISPSNRNYDVYHIMVPSKSFIKIPPIKNSGWQMVKNIPVSLLNVFIRPFPTDNGSNFKFILFVENLLLIAFLFYGFRNKKKLSETEKSWVFYLIVVAIIIALVIGWTTPILGAIARYKIASYLLLIVVTFITMRLPQTIKK